MDRIADLECYDQSHMHKTLINDKFVDKDRKFHKKKLKTVQGIVGHNRFFTTIKHNKMGTSSDVINYSDDNSNASITETQLD